MSAAWRPVTDTRHPVRTMALMVTSGDRTRRMTANGMIDAGRGLTAALCPQVRHHQSPYNMEAVETRTSVRTARAATAEGAIRLR